MALEIIDGRVVFKFDLGAGATTITNRKEVADGEWHEVVVERCLHLRIPSYFLENKSLLFLFCRLCFLNDKTVVFTVQNGQDCVGDCAHRR